MRTPLDPGDHHELAAARRFGAEILPQVSRTFAISIRLLPGELGHAVLCAYLLCRVADTVEDEPGVAPEAKAASLDRLLAGFDGPAPAAAFAAAVAGITGDAAHVRLTREAAQVFVLWRALSPRTRAIVRQWVTEMVVGMRKFVLLYPHGIRVQTLPEFKEYCYYVAGTVGYMLTDLWREHAGVIGERTYQRLRAKARAFGEALQTVNILKDVATDAAQENAIYIPQEMLAAEGSSHAGLLDPAAEGANHRAVQVLIAEAWKNLDDACAYLLLVPRRALPVRRFCILPLLYAYATLRDLTGSRAMLRRGGTVKISRGEVQSLLSAGLVLAVSNAGVRWLVAWVRRRPRPPLPPRYGRYASL
jgi:farnesyl-diphosphate farnesyltransferase